MLYREGVMIENRDTNFFTKKIYKLLMWWVIIDKWKNDINGGSRWKLVRNWLQQQFIKKCCKIICA